jgi:hypothetical protein
LDKFLAWTSDLELILESNRVTLEGLESMIGQLNHVAYLIPLSRHFLVRLQRRIDRKKPGKQEVSISRAERGDLLLWVDFLAMANKGISMNRLTYRKPSQLGWSDSCTSGLGGFSANGTAWRLKIPAQSPLFGVAKANNVFEFLAMAVTLWLILLKCNKAADTEECILILGDSTSALGWLYKASQVQESWFYHDAVLLISRKIASLLTNSSHCLASQHIKGSLNVVADLLSYCGSNRSTPHPLAADNPDNHILTNRFHSHLPQLIPQNFVISPVLDKILSFAVLVLRTTESSYIRRKREPTRIETESGADGPSSVPKWDSPITSSSLTYPDRSVNSSVDLSCHFTVPPNGTNQDELLGTVRHQWFQTLSAMPQAMWLRRFGTISNRAPFTSKGELGSYPQSDPSFRPINP